MNKSEQLIACLEGELAKRDARIAELGRYQRFESLYAEAEREVLQLRAELAAIKAQEPVAWKVSNPLTGDELLCNYKPSGAMYTYQPLYAAPVAKQVVMPEREWLQSDGLIYSLENDVNYYEINVTQVEGNRHDGKRAEFASKLIELLNAADQEGGQDE